MYQDGPSGIGRVRLLGWGPNVSMPMMGEEDIESLDDVLEVLEANPRTLFTEDYAKTLLDAAGIDPDHTKDLRRRTNDILELSDNPDWSVQAPKISRAIAADLGLKPFQSSKNGSGFRAEETTRTNVENIREHLQDN